MKRFNLKYLLILFIISIIFSSCNNDIKDTIDIVEINAWELRKPKLDENYNYIYDVGKKVMVQVNDEISLNVGEKSFEFKLMEMLNDDSFQINNNPEFGWITMDRVQWKEGDFYESSMEQFENLVLILNEFPNLKIQIGGFTDDKSRFQETEKITEKVFEQLIERGIDKGRLSYQFYGDKYLVCVSNDTDLCRAQNRRMDIRLIYK